VVVKIIVGDSIKVSLQHIVVLITKAKGTITANPQIPAPARERWH